MAWVDAKARTGANAPSDLDITVGGVAGSAFVSVTGYVSPRAPGTYYRHYGTTYSKAYCGSGTGAEEVSNTLVSGTGDAVVRTITVSATPESCGTRPVTGVYAWFKWGGVGDRGAVHSMIVQLFLPGHPQYDSTTSSSNIQILPDVSIDSPYIDSVAAALGIRYASTAACLALGEKARTHALRSSVPDVTLICTTQGLRKAVQFLLQNGLLEGFNTLYDSSFGSPVDLENARPDCDGVNSVGTCLEEGFWDPLLPEPSQEPTPEPDPAGGGIRPPPNCLEGESRSTLLDSMSVQDHHMATHYGRWGETFQDIVGAYDLSVVDSARLWNVHSMQHAGPHPWSYHNWVLENMRLAHEEAQTAPESAREAIFIDRFTRWVSNVVLEDPTIVRAGYWNCRDDYRWR